MAAANGTLTPPSLPTAPESPSIAKRKHADTAVVLSNGASAAALKATLNGTTHTLKAVLEDVLSILKCYDTQPSILTHAVPALHPRSSSGEADTKRAKLAQSDSSSTITERVQKGAYDSLQALEKDVESVAAEIASSGSSDTPATLEETKLHAKVLAFQKVLKSLVEREEARSAQGQKDEAAIVATAEAVTLEDAPIKVKELSLIHI